VSEVANNLAVLCNEIGPRFAGTESYRRAAEFMVGQFAAYQLNRPHLEPFAFTAWRRGVPARLIITAPVTREFECYALPYSPTTDCQAPLVNGGTGSVADLAGLGPGFVVTDGASGHRQEVYERLVARSFAGIILINRTPGGGLHTGSVGNGQPGKIPAVSVRYEDGQALRQLLAVGDVSAHLIADSHLEPATTWNVVGELPGSECPEELVIVGGHLDSHDIGPGAYDNAAGAVMVLEMARLLAQRRGELKRTVRFIGFAAEEIGLLGSQHHARAHAEELRRARAMFNCDTPGLSRPWGLVTWNYPRAGELAANVSRELGVEYGCREGKHNRSDQFPFTALGVPAVVLSGGRGEMTPPFYLHMAGDTADRIPTAKLAAAAVMAAHIVLRLANDPGRKNLERKPVGGVSNTTSSSEIHATNNGCAADDRL